MNPDSPDSIAALREIDKICQEYESSWSIPNISDFVRRAESDGVLDVGLLVTELVALDLELRSDIARTTSRQLSELLPKYKSQITKSEASASTGPHAFDTRAGLNGDQWKEPRYESIGELAKGGLGKVSIANDRYVNRKVAFKEVLGKYANSTGHQARLINEARITGNLEHPGIVPIYDIGVNNGNPFYCMRLVKGDTLEGLVNEYYQNLEATPGSQQRLQFRKLLRVFVDICNAVNYAHKQGVIHRDIKPQNVMVGRHGETLVLDWGLAKKLEGDADEHTAGNQEDSRTETKLGDVIGTPFYMSPEQAAGKVNELDSATDIYGLGATLFSILTGLFPNASTCETIVSIDGKLLKTLKQVNPRTPRALEAVCQKAMANQPEHRYQTAGELALDIERFLADEKVLADDEPKRESAARFFRRNKLAMTGLLTGAFALLAGLIAYSLIAARNNERLALERNDAIAAKKEAQFAEQSAIGMASFLENCFTNLSPGKVGEDFLVIDALEVGLNRLNALDHRPKFKARMSRVIGSAYSSLGLADKAIEAFRVGLGIDDSKLPEGFRMTVGLNLADVLIKRGEFDEATDLIKPYLVENDDSLASLRIRMRWSMLLRVKGESEKLAKWSLPIVTALLRHSNENPESDLPDVAVESVNYLSALQSLGRLAEAEEFAVRIFEGLQSKSSEGALALLRNIALLQSMQGKLNEATVHYETILKSVRSLYGDSHPELLSEQINFAQHLIRLKRYKESISICKQPLENNAFHQLDPNRLRAWSTLGKAYELEGLLEESLKAREESLTGHEQQFGRRHTKTLDAFLDLEQILTLSGKFESSQKLLTEYMDVMVTQPKIHQADYFYRVGFVNSKLGEPETAKVNIKRSIELFETTEQAPPDFHCMALSKLSMLELNSKNLEQALIYADQSIAIGRRLLSQPNWAIGYPLYISGEILQKQKKHSMAIERLELAYEQVKGDPNSPQGAIILIVAELEQSCQAINDTTKGKKWSKIGTDLKQRSNK